MKSRIALVVLLAAAAAALSFALVLQRPWLVAGIPAGAQREYLTSWKTWLPAQGLPHQWVFSVRVQGDRVWCGTEDGAAVLDTNTGAITSYGTKDGLVFPAVTSYGAKDGLVSPAVTSYGAKDGLVSPAVTSYGAKDGLVFPAVLMIDYDRRGNVWFATAGGVSRFDGKRWTSFTRESSGLVNNVVYGVVCHGDEVWFATTDGVSRYLQGSGEWKTYRLDNAPLEEVWCYGICSGGGKIWVAAWGGGLVEYDLEKERWQAWHDPDGVFDVDLVRDDGVISMMTIGSSWAEGLAWAGTYFGLSCYDGRRWRDWDEDHGLPSNFLNSVRARGRQGWACTDKGLACVDTQAARVVAYQRRESPLGPSGLVTVKDFAGNVTARYATRDALCNNFVWQADFAGDDIWLATSKGLCRGGRGGAR